MGTYLKRKEKEMINNKMNKVQEFYNETPFPDYELSRFENKDSLKNHAKLFPNILDRSIKNDASIIDVGTGTGQLSAFLSLERTEVYGIDFSDSSLNKAKALKEKLDLNSLTLLKIDITNPDEIKIIDKQFDYLLCLGVLHHTGNAYQSFKNILPLLKSGGFIAIGLYNRYGRIPLKIRKVLARTIFKNNQKVKDNYIKIQIGDVADKERARGWWNDQYNHPHETTHTIGQVLKWFKENNIEYIETLPSSSFKDKPIEFCGVWNKSIYPYLPLRFYHQLTWISKTNNEGGYWITFGRKK